MTPFSVLPVLIVLSGNIPQIKTAARIVGGCLASIEQFPFIVSLQLSGRHLCGGSLIGERFVVTAAHCFDISCPPDSIKAGTDNLVEKGVSVKIKRVSIHPEYNRGTLEYDVAVVELETAVTHVEEENPYWKYHNGGQISYVQLPKYVSTFTGQKGKVAGWGATNYHEKLNHLKAIDVEVVDKHECGNILGLNITESMICAGPVYGRRGYCMGDSGGPLVINDILHGVISLGVGPCGLGLLGVYTDVSAVSTWIEEVASLEEVTRPDYYDDSSYGEQTYGFSVVY